jgi:hypothetical protein
MNKTHKEIPLITGLLVSLFAQDSLFAPRAAGAASQDVNGTKVLNAGVGLGHYSLGERVALFFT